MDLLHVTRRVSLLVVIGAATTPFVLAATEDGPQITIVYPVSHLPVWEVDAQGQTSFNAAILVAHIKSTVGPDSWDTKSIQAIAGLRNEHALLIRQSRSNHHKIQALLKSFAQLEEEDQFERSSSGK